MLIAGRAIGGIACGQLLSVVPIYIAEISPPTERGFLVGLQGMAIAIGFCVANWIGYGGSFAAGDAQWRIPLAMQIPGALCLSIGVCFVPYTPRWLVQKDRFEEASKVLTSFHGDDHDLVAQELIQIREQIRLEKLQSQVSWFAALRQLFSRQYLRRTATATFILAMTQLSGSSVIQNFQNIFYATVGFEGQQALLISGIYGLMGVIGQAFYLVVVADRWPRARTLSTGSVVLAALIAVCMALSAVYGQENNTKLDGARGAIAFIFIYSAAYAVFFNGTVWVVCSELFPFFLRSRGIAISIFMQSVVAIVLSQITPIALAQVSWRYYALFIATNLAAGIIYFFFLPETAGKSLEEVGELFGDTLATDHIGAIDVASKHGAVELEEVEEPVSSQMKATV
ncbi:general substrate transporter [Apiospora arundinis]